MTPHDDRSDWLADFGPFNALPAVLAFWLLLLGGAAAGWVTHDLLIATECAR